MKSLTLVRHAKSSWSDASLVDHDRPLNHRGLKDAPVMGQRLSDRGCVPEQILCSTATRARETANLLLAPLFSASLVNQQEVISYTPSIYEAGVSDLIDCLSGVDEAIQHVMMIGHNPGLEGLCEVLVRGAVDRMATCAVASFELNVESWSAIGDHVASNTGTHLGFHDYPKNNSRL